MEDVGYYVTCILNCTLSFRAWQCLTAGRLSSHTRRLLLLDLIRENAHHSFPILSANNYKALQASCKNSQGFQRKAGIKARFTSARALIRKKWNLRQQSHQTRFAWNAIENTSRTLSISSTWYRTHATGTGSPDLRARCCGCTGSTRGNLTGSKPK